MRVRRALRSLAGVLLALGLAGAVAAQEPAGEPTPAGPAAEENGAITRGGGTLADEAGLSSEAAAAEIGVVGIDYASWEAVAGRAEGVVTRGQGSDFVLRRLRADLVEWRDLFLAEQSVNARRIQTVTGQLAALGPAPAEADPPEDPAVTDRRDALQTQLAALRAPGRLAEEAHARADGLIREIDVLLRAKARAQLLERGPSPLSPVLWRDVGREVAERSAGFWKELRVSLTSQARLQVLAANWPWVLVYLVVAWGLFRRGGRVTRRIAQSLALEFPRGAAIWRLLGSFVRAMLPVFGVTALVAALGASGMFGFRVTRMLEVLPVAALVYCVARWLSDQVFGAESPEGLPTEGLLDDRAAAGRLFGGLGLVLAILIPVETLIDTGDIAPETRAAFLAPFEIALAVLLYRFGKTLLQRPTLPSGEGDGRPPEGVRLPRQISHLAGRLIMLASVLAPVLSVLGYGLAARSILQPTVLTLGLMAVVMLLHVLLAELYAFVVRDESVKRESLVPLLGAFALITLALPVVALIWGARVEDLSEIWTRFRDGYTIGDTRISPGDIATFLIVFGVGYAATRLVQGVMRGSILPKTRLDIGAQNALVSGLGYIGIFLAAMVAISTTGLNLSNVAIVAGALSVGIGFGLQTIVSNFVSGIILLIERPISEGDWIEVGGRMGYVRDISVRATRIETFDRTDVIVPNGDLVSGQVVNWTRGNLVGRVIVAVGVSFSSDIEKVMAILREIAEAHPMVLLSPPPAVVLVNFGADALNFEIRAIVRDINFGLTVRSEMNAAIARRFRDEGIDIPFPQRDVWVRNPEELRPDPRIWTSRRQTDAGEGEGEGE
jgi:potassium efflux system protein